MCQRRVFDVDRCYQSILSRTPDFASRIEMPDEVFTSAIILDALIDSALSPRVKARIVDFLSASHGGGLFSYFVESGLLPTDVDDTYVDWLVDAKVIALLSGGRRDQGVKSRSSQRCHHRAEIRHQPSAAHSSAATPVQQ